MPDLEKQMFSLLGNFYLSILQNEQQKERKKIQAIAKNYLVCVTKETKIVNMTT